MTITISALAVPGLNEDGSLNKETIKEFYFGGDFPNVLNALEHFRKNNPDASKEDLIFVYKYLGVVYASDPETKDRAESYMYQLLKLIPAVDLVDMYISDNIESIFRTVKERFYRMEKRQNPAGSSIATSKSSSSDKEVPLHKNRTVWMVAGGFAVVTAVTLFLIFSNGDEEPEAKSETLDSIPI